MELPVLTRIDHVGIACRDLNKSMELYQATFGLKVVTVETHEAQGVREAMLAVSEGALEPGYIQLLEPLGPDTPVGKFLARRGEGVHHIGYGVADIDERPRHGSMGASIAFLHPADLGGVLTELVQFVPPHDPPNQGLGGFSRMHRMENSEGPAKARKGDVVCLSPGDSRTRMADTRRTNSAAFTSSQD